MNNQFKHKLIIQTTAPKTEVYFVQQKALACSFILVIDCLLFSGATKKKFETPFSPTKVDALLGVAASDFLLVKMKDISFISQNR